MSKHGSINDGSVGYYRQVVATRSIMQWPTLEEMWCLPAAWLPASLVALLCTIDKNQYKSSITDHFARSTHRSQRPVSTSEATLTMLPISVPFAPGIYKIVVGIPLLIFAVLALCWGWNNLRLTLRMLQGRAPLPRGSSTPFVVVGVAFYLVVLAVGFGAGYFLLALETTRPTIISQDGIVLGAGPPLYRQRLITWREVTKITCNLPPRENLVRRITIYSRDTRAELGDAGVALESVLTTVSTRVPMGTVRPCEHGSLDHSWSY
jgi:hypothetical protein